MALPSTNDIPNNSNGIRKFSGLILMLVLLCFALWLLATRPSGAQIARGEPFFYWGHVDILRRPPLAIAGVIVIASWFFLHRVWVWMAMFRWGAALVFSIACGILTVVLPLLSLGQSAYHIDSEFNGQTMYHHFYQFDGIQQASCDDVVVQCDALGLVCHQVYRLNYSALCLGDRAPIDFEVFESELYLVVDGEKVVNLTSLD